MNKKNFKKFFTKRKVLVLSNVLFLMLAIVTCTLTILVRCGFPVSLSYTYDIVCIVFVFIIIHTIFTSITLVVYYLAIMAGALNKKYKEEVKDTEYEDKK